MAASEAGHLSGVVAEVYADALLPLARDADRMDVLADELRQVADLVDDQPDCHEALASPVVPLDRKLRLIERAFRGRTDDLTCDALGVIARHGRMGMLRAIAGEFRKAVQGARRQVDVTVTSAIPLDDEARKAVVERLTRRLGATPVLTERVDPEILGGLLMKAGDEVVDVSLRTELDQIKQTLARRLSLITAERGTLPGL